MGKLHNYVVHIRTSANHMTWFIECAGKMIPLDNHTRWNSWFLMLCVAPEDKVKAGLQLYVEYYEDDLKDDILSTSKWIHLCMIHDFLQSFHEATLFLQGDCMTLERVLESVDVLKDMIQTALVYCMILLTFLWLILSYQVTATKAKDKFMAPQLQCTKKKLAKYVKKLDDSPYYLVA